MYRTSTLAAITVAVLVAARTASPSAGHDEKEVMEASIHKPDALKWQDGPASLPPGAKIAVLEGDPTKAGPFVFRVKVPDGYRIPPHTHPKPERVTVISGTFKVGMGDTFDKKKMAAFTAGSFAFLDPDMHHYAMACGETIVQVHGSSPLQFNYINPEEDPSKNK